MVCWFLTIESNRSGYCVILILKGQSHKKYGEVRVLGVSLGQSRCGFLKFSDRPSIPVKF
jgi:hypothetical protein